MIAKDNKIIYKRVQESIENFSKLLKDEQCLQAISEAGQLIVQAIKNGNKLLICGNGGSAADAQHIAGEFLCRFYKNRNPMPAIALSTDTSVLTSISNDYSYDEVFSRQIVGLGKRGDILLGISTSGSSPNVLLAFHAAKKTGLKTVLLTGNRKNDMTEICDIVVTAPSADTPRIQEMHLLIEHILCEITEAEASA